MRTARLAAIGIVCCGLTIGGCKQSPPPAATGSAVQSTQTQSTQVQSAQPPGTLMSDGTYRNGAPSGQPAAGGPAPTAASNAAPSSLARSIPVGTHVEVTITQTLSASRNEVGDRFSGVLTRPIVLAGQPVLARGTHVEGSVVASKGRGHFAGAGDLGIELTSIAGQRVRTSEYERAAKGRGKRTAGFIGGGAGLGAILGAVAGGGRGAAIGALAGGGAGTAGAAYTGSRDVVIPSESVVTFRLRSPLSVNE